MSADVGNKLTGFGIGVFVGNVCEHAGVQGDGGIGGHIFTFDIALAAVAGHTGSADINRAEVRHLEINRFLSEAASGLTAGSVVIPHGVVAHRQRQILAALVHRFQPDTLIGGGHRGLHRNGALGAKALVNAAEAPSAVILQHVRKRCGRHITGQGFRLGVVSVHLKVGHGGRAVLHGDCESIRPHKKIAGFLPVRVRHAVGSCFGKLERHLVCIFAFLTGGEYHSVIQIPVSGMVCPRVGRSFCAVQRYFIANFDTDGVVIRAICSIARIFVHRPGGGDECQHHAEGQQC